MLTVLIFLILLSVLVLVHELGHFVAAKKLGVAVEEFGLGLPPKIRKLFSWQGTEFTLNWLPIGGFVRMRGEDREDQKGLKGAFYSQAPWKRAIILLAGVTMNMLLGIVIFSVVYFNLGIPETGDVVRVEGIAPGSPADAAGFKINDAIRGFSTVEEFIEFINQNRGQEITLSVERSDSDVHQGRSLMEIKIIPRPADQTPEGEGALGVAISNVEFIHYPWWQMPFRASWVGLKEALAWGADIFAGLIAMVVNLIIHGKVPTEVAGPVGIAKITGKVASQGWIPLAQFAGVLSVNLAIVNVLPIPALDGGRLLFLGIEKLLGRPINPKKERWANMIGYGVLITLILLATIQDLFRILSS